MVVVRQKHSVICHELCGSHDSSCDFIYKIVSSLYENSEETTGK